MFQSVLSSSLIKKAQEKGLIQVELIDLRKFTKDKHRTADDTPYGGGPGMVLKAEPIFEALQSLSIDKGSRVILTCPTGEPRANMRTPCSVVSSCSQFLYFHLHSPRNVSIA